VTDRQLTAAEVLLAHVEQLNLGVRSGSFAPMIDGFTEDAEMVFDGVQVGPFIGRDAIAAAYARQPPDDEVRLLGTMRHNGDGSVESDYAWLATLGTRAGRMIVTERDGRIARLVVTFEEGAYDQ
jgi:steroid Delta-isomerase